MRKARFILALVWLGGMPALSQTLFVSTTGDDSFPGTIDSSFKTIPKAIAVAQPGATIYVRGGTYAVDSTIRITKQGTETSPCGLLAYPGEHPVLDFSSMPVAGTNRGVSVSGSYWHIKGFRIQRAGDNGMYLSGSYNTIEQCALVGNADTGLQLDNGASNNKIINCDSFDNTDPGQGNADGFAAKLSVGTGNSFYGCRAWQNSDDGWDGYLRTVNDVSTTLEECWSFMNGYLADGTQSSGNGNGFKMGGSDARNLEHNMTLKHCLAFDNKSKGFDQNNNRGSMTLLNCTGYRNGTNYSIILALDSGKTATVTNCVALGMFGSLAAFTVQTTNSWMNPFVVTDADFISTDTANVRGQRKPDGSLPDVPFMHLAKGSDLIDAGTNVGLLYNGTGPDLGAFETENSAAVAATGTHPAVFLLYQNYPNPFNPTTTVQVIVGGVVAPSGSEGPTSGSVPPSAGRDLVPLERDGQWTADSWVRLVVYDLLGREVAVLANGRYPAGKYSFTFDGSKLASGMYFVRLSAGEFAATRSMTLLK